MAKITIKTKISRVPVMGDPGNEREAAKIPALDRSHCDMPEFRNHPKYGEFANSDLFPAMLERDLRGIIDSNRWIYLESLPDNVTVDTGGFLAEVSIEV